jgi:folate-binding protein YgfZ
MTTLAPAKLESQYNTLRRGAGLLESKRRVHLVNGPEAVEFLQGQVTNDVETLEPGLGCYALLLSTKGKILADLRIFMRDREELLLDTEPETTEVVVSNLTKYKIGRQVNVEDADRRVVSLIGPRSHDAFGKPLPKAEHAFTETELSGAKVLAVRTHLGVDVVYDRGDFANVQAALAERAERVSEESAEILRIEAGRPRYGHDMSEDNLPAEVGLEDRAVSFTKGCYVGQEPVARMHHRGHPNWHLRGLELSELAIPADRVIDQDKDVGTVTSACVSPALGPIALAILRREVEPGREVKVGLAAAAARVVELPFARAGNGTVGEP